MFSTFVLYYFLNTGPSIACYHKTWEAEAVGLQVWGHPGLYSEILSQKTNKTSQAPMAHSCNPSYLGGRDQEDCGSEPALGK
jgi:hypothetical protein